jgi:hypothetical protein
MDLFAGQYVGRVHNFPVDGYAALVIQIGAR